MLRRRSSSRKEPTPKQILSKFFDFLSSSIWALPVATFIEQKSTIFDRAYGEQAQNEYYACFKEFNGLVTTLIECFCGDVNIELSKFREAIGSLSQQRLSRQQRGHLEPVAASTDFDVFVPMMMRKNLELQLQALQMIEYLCGVIPQVLMLHEGESLKHKDNMSAEDTERYVLVSVLRQSKEEFDVQKATNFKQELQLMAQSGQEERQRIEEQVTKESQLMEDAIGDKLLNILPVEDSLETVKTAETRQQSVSQEVKHPEKEKSDTKPPTMMKRSESAGRSRAVTPSRSGENDVGESRAASAKRKSSVGRGTAAPSAAAASRAPLNDIRRPSLPNKPSSPSEPPRRPESPGMEHGPRRRNIRDVNALLTETERLSTADVEARRQYLKQQRDKLLEMKQNEREKHLHEITTRVAQERPRTAKAARGAIRGANPDLVARRNLMDKLKTEITEIHPAD